jgi:phosphoglycolate phosphatase
MGAGGMGYRRSERPAIRGLLFDKDGTLLDYAASWPPINRDAARLAAREDEALAAALLTLAGADPVSGLAVADSLLAAGNTRELAQAWSEAGSPLDIAALTAELDALFQGAVSRMVPVCALAPFFARLAGRGFSLGIATNDSAAAGSATARHFGLDDHLGFICGYDSGHGVKPAPGMVLAFCRETGLAPAEVAVIGDNSHDMEMGRAAGAGLRIAVLTGTGTRSTLEPISDLCLASIADLEAALSIQ